jgi:uncharacterized protein YqfA (UPF0365 family)
MDTNTQLLHSINAKLDNLDTRLCAIEAQGERHSFVQPKAKAKAVKAVKATKVAKKAKTPREASASQAHQAMKAELKTMPKEVQQAFSQAWLAIRQDAGYGKSGNIPLLDYFELQSDAFKAVVGA